MMLAGFYEKEITPPIGRHMPGSFDVRYSTGVKDERLMVKGAAFELNDKRVVILSVDVIYLHEEFVDFAVKKINKYIGVDEKNILIQAMHVHTAGPTRGAKGGAIPRDEAYIAFLGEMIADCGILAFHRMIPVTAKYAKTKVKGITFLRNYLMKDGSVRTNPDAQSPDVEAPFGVADEEFQVMYFYDEQGKPVGSITNFSCHHCVANCMEYCADYSGVLAKELKLCYGIDYINVMISGNSGNLNHFDFYAKDWTRGATKTPRYVQIGKVLAENVKKLADKAKPMSLDALYAEKEYVMMKRRVVPEDVLEEAKKLYEEIPLDSVVHNFDNLAGTDGQAYKRVAAESIIQVAKMPEMLPVCVQAIKLGECMIYAFSGEPFTEFGISVKEKSPSKYSMVASVANGATPGYIPTKETFGTAIYEAQFNAAKFEPDTGYKMVEKAIELAKKIY